MQTSVKNYFKIYELYFFATTKLWLIIFRASKLWFIFLPHQNYDSSFAASQMRIHSLTKKNWERYVAKKYDLQFCRVSIVARMEKGGLAQRGERWGESGAWESRVLGISSETTQSRESRVRRRFGDLECDDGKPWAFATYPATHAHSDSFCDAVCPADKDRRL